MIISASRRTDIPAFFSEWFATRLCEGYAVAKNPFNPKQCKRIELVYNAVDAFVFWTKNAGPFLEIYKNGLREYCHYYLYTVTGYGREIEASVPDVEYSFNTLRCLGEHGLGTSELVWRYDPVFLSSTYTLAWHTANFSRLATRFEGLSDTCIISFIDNYRSNHARCGELLDPLQSLSRDQLLEWLYPFVSLAKRYGIRVQTCSERVDLTEIGIFPGGCVDGNRIQAIRKKMGYDVTLGLFPSTAVIPANAKNPSVERKPHSQIKDRNQRKDCRCLPSVDIGAYGTCGHGCLYCYARGKPTAFEQDPHQSALGCVW